MKEITLEQKNTIYIDSITDDSIVGISCYNKFLKRNKKLFCIRVKPFNKNFYALKYINLEAATPEFPSLKHLISYINDCSDTVETYNFFIFDSTKELFNWLNE